MTKSCNCDYENKIAGCKAYGTDVTAISQSSLPVIWAIGPTGTSRSWQCEKLAEEFNLAHIWIGDLLRRSDVKKNLRHTTIIREYLCENLLVPRDIIFILMKQAMVREFSFNKKGFIINGFPRDNLQGLQFEREIKNCTMLLYFEMPEGKNREITGFEEQKRNEIFYRNIEGIIKMYEYKMIKINADRDKRVIFSDAYHAVIPLIKKNENNL